MLAYRVQVKYRRTARQERLCEHPHLRQRNTGRCCEERRTAAGDEDEDYIPFAGRFCNSDGGLSPPDTTLVGHGVAAYNELKPIGCHRKTGRRDDRAPGEPITQDFLSSFRHGRGRLTKSYNEHVPVGFEWDALPCGLKDIVIELKGRAYSCCRISFFEGTSK